MRRVRLKSEALSLAVDPSRGCRWNGLRARTGGGWKELLWTPRAAAKDPFRCAAYMMAPWCNRIVGAAFRFRNGKYALRPNFSDGTAIHGDVYARPWSASKKGPARLAARLDSRDWADFNFPFPLSFKQEIRLRGARLEWSFSIKNISNTPAPIGFGLHPFFLNRIGGEWGELSVPARRRYPSRHAVPTRDAVAFKETFDVRQSFDACYTVLQGPVVMRFPKQGFEWRLEFGRGFDHLYLYSPPSRRDILCIEPMTMAVDGFSRLARGKRGTGVRVLRPGESWGSSVSLETRVYSSTSSGSPV